MNKLLQQQNERQHMLERAKRHLDAVDAERKKLHKLDQALGNAVTAAQVGFEYLYLEIHEKHKKSHRKKRYTSAEIDEIQSEKHRASISREREGNGRFPGNSGFDREKQ